MNLGDRERRMQAGEMGEAARVALGQQIAVGEFFGAERFVPVGNVHMMGDMEVMGDAGFRFIEDLLAQGARFTVPVTTNARCVDFERAASVRQDPGLVARERALVANLRRLGALQVDTCINYQTIYQPHFREHVAWGDTGTVIWANSVCGARSNYEAGPAALAAGITGVTPAYGYHLDEQRRGSLRFELSLEPRDWADWGALGGIVGRRTLDYWKVPVITGVGRAPGADDLKHFGAALASYGSCAMYHMVGVTPEARDEAEAFGGGAPEASLVIDGAMLEAFYRTYPENRDEIDAVIFSAPQLSVLELRRIAELLAGRRVHGNTALLITTNFANREVASRLGYVDAIEKAGGQVLSGTCWYIMEPAKMAQAFGWRNILTNSAKMANIIGGYRLFPILRRTDACVEAAVTGRLPESARLA
ncbi:MAG: aconitase X catalytic domain-containing protein [Candidatus Rokubacteria bacterium]|nr:aconitase X catalytic domain-containing protein [Candidatus Rokubacteria bacterium]